MLHRLTQPWGAQGCFASVNILIPWKQQLVRAILLSRVIVVSPLPPLSWNKRTGMDWEWLLRLAYYCPPSLLCVCPELFAATVSNTAWKKSETLPPCDSGVVTCWPGIQSLSNVSFSCRFIFKSEVARLSSGKVISLTVATAVPPLPRCSSTPPFFSWCASHGVFWILVSLAAKVLEDCAWWEHFWQAYSAGRNKESLHRQFTCWVHSL